MRFTYLNCTCTVKSHLVPEMSLLDKNNNIFIGNIPIVVKLIDRLIGLSAEECYVTYTKKKKIYHWQKGHVNLLATQFPNLIDQYKKISSTFLYLPETPLRTSQILPTLSPNSLWIYILVRSSHEGSYVLLFSQTFSFFED